mmetsp:Transcript_15234/g.37366  ORF Transcript_15234/g.37366 Transcript_15234/m.37366 type:complete len:523 (+) Transcript_15234:1517-3085(+)
MDRDPRRLRLRVLRLQLVRAALHQPRERAPAGLLQRPRHQVGAGGVPEGGDLLEGGQHPRQPEVPRYGPQEDYRPPRDPRLRLPDAEGRRQDLHDAAVQAVLRPPEHQAGPHPPRDQRAVQGLHQRIPRPPLREGRVLRRKGVPPEERRLDARGHGQPLPGHGARGRLQAHARGRPRGAREEREQAEAGEGEGEEEEAEHRRRLREAAPAADEGPGVHAALLHPVREAQPREEAQHVGRRAGDEPARGRRPHPGAEDHQDGLPDAGGVQDDLLQVLQGPHQPASGPQRARLRGGPHHRLQVQPLPVRAGAHKGLLQERPARLRDLPPQPEERPLRGDREGYPIPSGAEEGRPVDGGRQGRRPMEIPRAPPPEAQGRVRDPGAGDVPDREGPCQAEASRHRSGAQEGCRGPVRDGLEDEEGGRGRLQPGGELARDGLPRRRRPEGPEVPRGRSDGVRPLPGPVRPRMPNDVPLRRTACLLGRARQLHRLPPRMQGAGREESPPRHPGRPVPPQATPPRPRHHS